MANKEKPERLCDRDCNNCPIIGHDNTRVVSAILNRARDRFGSEFYHIVQAECPNLTVCSECRIDDFCHVEGCEILKHNDEAYAKKETEPEKTGCLEGGDSEE